MFSQLDTSQSNEFHQRLVAAAVDVREPQSDNDERDNRNGPLDSRSQSKLTCHRDLENDQADDDAVTNHDPAASCRVLSVVHGVQELILVHKVSNDKISQAR